MKIGAALVLLAAGAILRFAIAANATHGIDLRMVGDILMIIGAIGLVIWLIVWAPWATRRRATYPPAATYPPGSQYPPPRTPLEEDEEERLAARRAERYGPY
jgi:hypothetical protein